MAFSFCFLFYHTFAQTIRVRQIKPPTNTPVGGKACGKMSSRLLCHIFLRVSFPYPLVEKESTPLFGKVVHSKFRHSSPTEILYPLALIQKVEAGVSLFRPETTRKKNKPVLLLKPAPGFESNAHTCDRLYICRLSASFPAPF